MVMNSNNYIIKSHFHKLSAPFSIDGELTLEQQKTANFAPVLLHLNV